MSVRFLDQQKHDSKIRRYTFTPTLPSGGGQLKHPNALSGMPLDKKLRAQAHWIRDDPRPLSGPGGWVFPTDRTDGVSPRRLRGFTTDWFLVFGFCPFHSFMVFGVSVWSRRMKGNSPTTPHGPSSLCSLQSGISETGRPVNGAFWEKNRFKIMQPYKSKDPVKPGLLPP